MDATIVERPRAPASYPAWIGLGLGAAANSEVAASFIWATIQRLYAARRSGLKKEMFGYVPGGYAHVLDGDTMRAREVRVTAGPVLDVVLPPSPR